MANTMKLGINGSDIQYYNCQLAFKDLRKQSAFYFTSEEGGAHDTGGTFIPGDYKTDASGNPTNYTSSGVGLAMPANTQARAMIVYELADGRDNGEPIYPSGIYHVFYEGKGTIKLANDPGNYTHTATGTGSFSSMIATPSRAGIRLDISSVDASAESDYLRNIRIVHDDDLDYETNPFNQKMLDSFKELSDSDGGYFRAMNWLYTNRDGGSGIPGLYQEWRPPATPTQLAWRVANSSWDDRVKTFQPQGDIGGSLEYAVDICNTIDRNLWYCVPHRATPDFITSAATYIRDNLNASLSTVVEWSNEFWNTGFYSHFYCWSGARMDSTVSAQYYSEIGTDGYRASLRYGADKTKEAHDVFSEVFNSQPTRLIRTIGAPAAIVWHGERMLTWSGINGNQVSSTLDSIATAPYFGGNLGHPTIASTIASPNVTGTNGSLNATLASGPWSYASSVGEILASATYDVTNESGVVRNRVKEYKALADKMPAVELYLYEAGQHLIGIEPYLNAMFPLFSACNSDPGMDTLYTLYLNMLQDEEVSLTCMYRGTTGWSRHSMFGLQEYYNQVTRPKYDAILAWLYTQPATFLNNVKYRLDINS